MPLQKHRAGGRAVVGKKILLREQGRRRLDPRGAGGGGDDPDRRPGHEVPGVAELHVPTGLSCAGNPGVVRHVTYSIEILQVASNQLAKTDRAQ